MVTGSSKLKTENSKLKTGNWRLDIGNFTPGARQSNVQNPKSKIEEPESRTPSPEPRGFTLLELMVVLVLMLIVVSIAVPAYNLAIMRAREAVLRDDLTTMRRTIDEFTVDKQRPPQSLQELADAGYLRGGVPVDPFTQSNDTWQVDIDEVPTGSDAPQSGVVDVHSGASGTALDGTTTYNTW